MNTIEKIRILKWVKDKYKINIPYVKRNLSDESFLKLLKIFSSLKSIGGIFEASDVVEDFMRQHGKQYFSKEGCVDNFLLKNTHMVEEGKIKVCVRHLLMSEWRMPSRSNVRFITKRLKEEGYQVSNEIALDSLNFYREPHLSISLDCIVKLPINSLKVYSTEEEYPFFDVSEFLNTSPKFNVDLIIPPIWKSHYVKRVIDLFEMSELPYIYKSSIRGFYQKVPPVEMLCHIAFRDVFSPKSLRDWVSIAMEYEPHKLDADSKKAIIPVIEDFVFYKMSQTTLLSKQIKIDKSNIFGWQVILLIKYVRDALMKE